MISAVSASAQWCISSATLNNVLCIDYKFSIELLWPLTVLILDNTIWLTLLFKVAKRNRRAYPKDFWDNFKVIINKLKIEGACAGAINSVACKLKSALLCWVTFYHKTCRDADHCHLIAGNTGVVTSVVTGQVGDGQQTGHLVYPDSLATVHGNSISEPGDQHWRVTLRHKAGLTETLALFKIITEDKVLNFWCN